MDHQQVLLLHKTNEVFIGTLRERKQPYNIDIDPITLVLDLLKRLTTILLENMSNYDRLLFQNRVDFHFLNFQKNEPRKEKSASHR